LGDEPNARAALKALVSLPPAITAWDYLKIAWDDVHRIPDPDQTRHEADVQRILKAIEQRAEAKSLLALQKAAGKVLKVPVEW
jgi:hypothetical protein